MLIYQVEKKFYSCLITDILSKEFFKIDKSCDMLYIRVSQEVRLWKMI